MTSPPSKGTWFPAQLAATTAVCRKDGDPASVRAGCPATIRPVDSGTAPFGAGRRRARGSYVVSRAIKGPAPGHGLRDRSTSRHSRQPSGADDCAPAGQPTEVITRSVPASPMQARATGVHFGPRPCNAAPMVRIEPHRLPSLAVKPGASSRSRAGVSAECTTAATSPSPLPATRGPSRRSGRKGRGRAQGPA